MRILLIDDDQSFTELMREYLQGEGFECECVSDPVEGLERAQTSEFDALLLDVMMPKLDGIEVLRRLRGTSAIPVLMLTAKGDQVDRVIGLELGADDYVPKPVYPRELVARLRAVLRRYQVAPRGRDPRVEQRVGSLRIDLRSRKAWIGAEELALTVSEFDLLAQLAAEPGAALTKDDLSERALRRPREPYDRSIDVHISNLRQKIAAAGGGVEIETVRAVGYRLRAPQ